MEESFIIYIYHGGTLLAFVNEIANIIHYNCKEVESIDLSNNSIKTLAAFNKLANKAVNVKAISFSQNYIDNVDEFDYISQRNSKWTSKLHDLVITSNPIANDNNQDLFLLHQQLLR